MERSPGRPRAASLDGALTAAAAELLLESGFRGVTIHALTTRAGTTRPSFYRRYSGIPELLLDMLRHRYGASLQVDTGSLPADLLAIQRDQVAMFSDSIVRRSLAGFLDALQDDEPLQRSFVDDFFQPRRTATKDVIGRGVVRGEIPVPDDLEWICDLITSPFVMRATFPALGPIDDELARTTTRVALKELGWVSPQPG